MSEREAFEAWLLGSYGKVYSKEDCDRFVEHGHVCWLAWKARAAVESNSVPDAATAPLLAQIAELQAELKLTSEMNDQLREQNTSVDQSCAQLEEQLAEARKDAERYRWVASKVRERPLRPAAYGSEMFPDMRLRYELPVLVSYDAIGQQISFDAAIDTAIAKELPATPLAQQEQPSHLWDGSQMPNYRVTREENTEVVRPEGCERTQS